MRKVVTPIIIIFAALFVAGCHPKVENIACTPDHTSKHISGSIVLLLDCGGVTVTGRQPYLLEADDIIRWTSTKKPLMCSTAGGKTAALDCKEGGEK